MKTEQNFPAYFVQIPFGFSYLLSSDEERFLKHLLEFEWMEKMGGNLISTRVVYSQRMNIPLFTFDRCGKSLCRLGLATKSDNPSGMIKYNLNRPVFERLTYIVSVTKNPWRLMEFFKLHITTLGKSIPDLTDEDIAALRR